MSEISEFDLISGANIHYKNICTLRQPTLQEIVDIGYNTYQLYLYILSQNLDTLMKSDNAKEYISILPDNKKNIFSILISEKETRELLKQALSFFIVENIKFDNENQGFLLSDKRGTCGVIYDENFEKLWSGIARINFLAEREPPPTKFLNDFAKEIYEECNAGSPKKNDDNLNLANIINSVSVQHASYNLLNIWGLTVYQLYSQFSKLNMKVQIDVAKLRWAAWGKEEFDFSTWFKK